MFCEIVSKVWTPSHKNEDRSQATRSVMLWTVVEKKVLKKTHYFKCSLISSFEYYIGNSNYDAFILTWNEMNANVCTSLGQSEGDSKCSFIIISKKYHWIHWTEGETPGFYVIQFSSLWLKSDQLYVLGIGPTFSLRDISRSLKKEKAARDTAVAGRTPGTTSRISMFSSRSPSWWWWWYNLVRCYSSTFWADINL